MAAGTRGPAQHRFLNGAGKESKKSNDFRATRRGALNGNSFLWSASRMARSGNNHKGGRPYKGDRTLFASRIPTELAVEIDRQRDSVGISRTEAIVRLVTWAAAEGVDVAQLPPIHEKNNESSEELTLTG